MKEVIALYIPAIHQGYIELFDRHPNSDILVVDRQKISELEPELGDILSRDKRTMGTDDIVSMLGLKYSIQNRDVCSVSSGQSVAVFLESYEKIIMPHEDVSAILIREFPGKEVYYDNWFLRHDWSSANVKKEIIMNNISISTNEIDQFFISMATTIAGGSSDWWRQVGAVLPYDETKALTAFNAHMPFSYSSYVIGDSRLYMQAGERPEICGALHAEADIICQAAEKGLSIKGKKMYVTTFPCPVCARMIAKAGITELYFKEGYSVLDAQPILESYKVKLFQVK